MRSPALLPIRLFSAIAFLAASLGGAAVEAAERRLLMAEDADYFGFDYEIVRDVELEACKSACLADGQCQALTYNVAARWCFLKSGLGELRAVRGAVSGRVVTDEPVRSDVRAERVAELRFLPQRYVDEARRLEGRLRERSPASAARLPDILAEATGAAERNDLAHALELYRLAVGLAPDRYDLWRLLAELAFRVPLDRSGLADVPDRQTERTAAAIGAFLRAESEEDRAALLALAARALQERAAWKPALAAYRASLRLRPDAGVERMYEALQAEHGMRIVDHVVQAESSEPRICIVFSEHLPAGAVDLASFVSVGPERTLAVEAEDKQICIAGVEHGRRYEILVRAGLPSADGEELPRSATLNIFVPDRPPSARFFGNAYVLPAGGEPSVPLVTINTETIEAEVLRIGDRQLARAVGDGTFLSQLYDYEARQIASRTGEKVWQGRIEVPSALNQEVTTAVPVGELVPELKPGAYVITARPANIVEEWGPKVTQWFVVSDTGLSALSANDGFHVFARSLTTAEPLAGIGLRLVAVNNEILGRATTDEGGYAAFPAGLARGTGGSAPALLVAERADGDYNFLDLTRAPFDLTDRGVDGRPSPGALDLFLTTERGIYRAGEPVHITALVRDAKAEAVPGLPLTAIIKRPDGMEASRFALSDQGLGGGHAVFHLNAAAMRGTWRIGVHADVQSSPLAETVFLVEDFRPERLDFELVAEAPEIDPADPGEISLTARFLYGQAASGLMVEGETVAQPVDNIARFPGYRFGLHEDRFDPLREPLPTAETGEDGSATVPLQLAELPPSSRPLEAIINVRVLDPGGHPVERSLTLPVASDDARIGIRPLFSDAVQESSPAAFDIVAVGADGARAETEVAWELIRVERRFQWYRSYGHWNYEPIESRHRVATGRLSIPAERPARLEVQPGWGAHELVVSDESGAALPASVRFEAGWYVKARAADTPEALKIALDRPRYRVGETARVHLEARFPGIAQVMVLDDRLVASQIVEVPEGGAEIELPVTAEWGPGAYVTAALYRPMDLAARRMPARALGLAWAEVDPGDRKLQVALDTSGGVAPRQPFEVGVALANVAPGEEAYVAVAAVDAGILNLTRHRPPAPDEWYFAQRRLGAEIRDVYGFLIDRLQGARGIVRSGGDAPLARFEGPPPTDILVAMHSGVVRVGPDGAATVRFDMPDFNGTVRLMAMAWTRAGVGHAAEDVIVRDPVVVSVSQPSFLAPGDRSRLLLDLAADEEGAGAALLEIVAGNEAVSVPADSASRRLELTAGARQEVRVPISATAVGDGEVTARLTLDDGRQIEKRLTVAVRNNEPEVVRASEIALSSGGTMRLGPDIAEGFLADTASVAVSVGRSRLNVPAILSALDRFPYGCTEQLVSRALPLLYLDSVALASGLRGDPDVRKRIQDAIAAVLANQAANGAFGLWRPDSGDLWLDAYVTDFLTRARQTGHAVPQQAFERALDNLQNSVAYAADFDRGGEEIAYALYVLAANGRASIGDLRYYAETKLDAFGTPLARAQIGAALALYGDRGGADAVFRRVLVDLEAREDRRGWRADYGSDLRDAAAALTLASETGSTAIDLTQMSQQLDAAWGASPYRSTQDNAWALLAAHALIGRSARAEIAIDGIGQEGPLYRSFEAWELSAAPMIENRGAEPVSVLVTIAGVSETPEPAGGNFYEIGRAYYTLDGEPADPAHVAQGTRLVAVLTVTSMEGRAARLIVNDPLPAGFEIDNPHLLRSGEVGGLGWLRLADEAAHVEFRSDRFVAALDRGEHDATELQLAYVVRAVSPGFFAHPAAMVEDMYRPERRARTAPGRAEVVGPLR